VPRFKERASNNLWRTGVFVIYTKIKNEVKSKKADLRTRSSHPHIPELWATRGEGLQNPLLFRVVRLWVANGGCQGLKFG
jgi:hypothetical protein